MKNVRIGLQLTTLASVVAALVSAPGFAQDESSGRSMVLEEVLVTAQKREESLQNTPISITALGKDALEGMGVYEAQTAGDYIPNLVIQQQPGTKDNYAISIRQVATAETSLLNDGTVALYSDGVYLGRSTGAAFDLVELERIEVLRGPQGTLYGRNTIGGAINLITAKPTDEFGFRQQLSTGNRGYFRSVTSVDTGKFGDFSVKLSYAMAEKDGNVTNSAHNNSPGETESDAARVALRWTPTESFTADYVYDSSKRRSNPSLFQITKVRDLHASMGGAITQQAAAYASRDRKSKLSFHISSDNNTSSDIDAHSLTLEWALDNVTFKSITAYRDWESEGNGSSSNEFGSFLADGATVLDGAGGMLPAGTPVAVFNAGRISEADQFSQEIQAMGTAMNDKLKYTVGLFYFDETVYEDNPQQFMMPAAIAYGAQPQVVQSFLCMDPTFSNPYACVGKDTVLYAPIFIYGSDNKSKAVYGQFTYSLTDRLDATLGVRYSEDEKDVFLENSTIIRDEGIERVTADNDWDNVSTAFTLNYQWTDDVSIYASYSEGYRSGGFSARATTADAFQTPFDEELVTSYEFGWKADLFDNRVRFNGAIYHYDYEDAQINQFTAGAGGASSKVVNAGESEADGIEVEITAIPIEGLTITAAYGYSDFEYNSFVTTYQDPDTGFSDPSGNIDIADIAKVQPPKQTGSLIVQYDFEPFSFGQLSARIDNTYTGKRNYHAMLNKFNESGAASLINARVSLAGISIAGGNLDIAAWGKNITNERNREFGIDFAALGFAGNSYKEMASYGIDLVFDY